MPPVFFGEVFFATYAKQLVFLHLFSTRFILLIRISISVLLIQTNTCSFLQGTLLLLDNPSFRLSQNPFRKKDKWLFRHYHMN